MAATVLSCCSGTLLFHFINILHGQLLEAHSQLSRERASSFLVSHFHQLPSLSCQREPSEATYLEIESTSDIFVCMWAHVAMYVFVSVPTFTCCNS